MAKEKIKDVVAALAQPIVEEHGLELVDVEWVREGKDWFLRVYIYKQDGVSIDDCVAVNRELEKQLDKLDPIKDPYVLEVSSPGLDRPFRTDKDFERYKGSEVEVQLYQPENGKKVFEGKLVGLIDGQIVICVGSEEVAFAKDVVATVKRTIKF